MRDKYFFIARPKKIESGPPSLQGTLPSHSPATERVGRTRNRVTGVSQSQRKYFSLFMLLQVYEYSICCLLQSHQYFDHNKC